MEFNLTKFLPSNWLHALGATLFHSLWLGVVLALLIAVVLFFTRKASAVLRYNILTATLFLFVLAIGLIFYNALDIHSSVQRIRIITEDFDWKMQAQESKSVQANLQSGITNIINIWDAYAQQIVLIWFLIICIKSIQLIAGLTKINYLKNTKVYAAGIKWDEKVIQLSEKLGITQKVNILQSGITQVPIALGYFKPLILIPLGLLNGLGNDEVEAILCHELAHIKRRDYLINLLQSFIEVVFFFNPAVLWLSKLIREERENCCDDLAVSQIDDKRNYVKALITCQEFQLNAPSLAMAVTGRKNHLFNRISRMLFDTKTTLNKMEKTILTVALVSVVICAAAFKNVTEPQKSIKNVTQTSYSQSFQDTIKKTKVRSEIDKKQADLDRQQAVKDAKQAQEDSKQAIIDAKQAAEDAKQANNDAKIAIEDAKQAKQDALQVQIDLKIALEDAKLTKKNNSSLNTLSPIPPATPGTLSPLAPITPPVQSTPPVKTKRDASTSKTLTITGTQRTTESIRSTNSDNHDYNSIIKEMIQDGIIKNPDKLSYKLDKNSLIINGKKQAENLHQKYKNKYLQRENTALLYNYEMSASTTTTP